MLFIINLKINEHNITVNSYLEFNFLYLNFKIVFRRSNPVILSRIKVKEK